MIAQAATEPTSVLTWAFCATGFLALAYLVWRHRAGRPVLKTSPAAFPRVNPVALALIALVYFLLYGLAGVAVATTQPTAAIGGALATLAGGLFLYVVVLRRVFRPQGSQAERIGRGFLVLWAAMPVVFGAFLLLQVFGLEGSQKSITWMAERRPGWRIIVLHAVLVAPVAEETCFRGLLYPALRQLRGPRYAILLTAAVFGVIHVLPAVVLPMVLFGAAMAWMCETNGSFLPCLLAHIAFNALTVVQLLVRIDPRRCVSSARVERFASVLGILVLLGIGYACSSARRKVPWRLVAVGIGLQVWLALFIVRADWVPGLLTAAAGICALILVAGLLRDIPGYWLPAARGLGFLGLTTMLLHAANLVGAWWGYLVVIALVWGATRPGRPLRDMIAVIGCLAVLAALWLMELPNDFVFRAVDWVGKKVKILCDFATLGADQVFGGLRDAGGFVFAIDIGAIILLFGGLLSVLYHIGVIPWLVGLMARVLHRALGVSGAESLAAASNVFVGQTEAPLVIRAYLPGMTRSEIMALMTGGFATIAGSVLGAYIIFLQNAGFGQGAAHLIAASVMSAPAAFVLAKLFVPETEVSQTRDGAVASPEALGTNVLDALASGVTAALKLAVNVVAMLLVFYALIFILNAVVDWVAHVVFGAEDVTFQMLYARLFQPFAWLIGVPAEDTLAVGELLGTKTIFNEFIAYDNLGGMIQRGELQPRSAVLSTYALCGFANFMSIGIQIAGLGQLAPGKRKVFAQLALRAMVAGALACQLTACVVGVIGRF